MQLHLHLCAAMAFCYIVNVLKEKMYTSWNASEIKSEDVEDR